MDPTRTPEQLRAELDAFDGAYCMARAASEMSYALAGDTTRLVFAASWMIESMAAIASAAGEGDRDALMEQRFEQRALRAKLTAGIDAAIPRIAVKGRSCVGGTLDFSVREGEVRDFIRGCLDHARGFARRGDTRMALHQLDAARQLAKAAGEDAEGAIADVAAQCGLEGAL